MRVLLNVYDLPEQEANNEALHNVGVGFYHSGIEVISDGCHFEYSFSTAGISRTRPQLEGFGRLREQINMGDIEGGTLSFLTETMNGISSGQGFVPGAYHIVHRNCNHFSDVCCKALVNQGIPVWINRAANMAATFSSANKGGPATNGDKSLPMPGRVAAPTLNNKFSKTADGGRKSASSSRDGQTAALEEGGSSSIFSWFFGSSSRSETASTPVKKHPPPKKRDPSAKKELTEKQKAALAKIKGCNK